MKYKILFYGFTIFLCLILASCGVNVFSAFNPTDVNSENNVNSLVGMGDDYLRNLDYDNAYKAYSKALKLDPRNSRAIEGVCTSYLYLKIPVADMIGSIISSSYSNINKNDLYDASTFLADNLYKIVNNEADGIIPYNDVNVNFDFFIFNTLYGICYLVDSDNNNNIQNDNGDIMNIGNNFIPVINPIVTNTLDKATNTSTPNPLLFPKFMRLISPIKPRYNYFTNNMQKSYYSLSIIQNVLKSDQAKQQLESIKESLNTSITQLGDLIQKMNNPDTNTNSTLTNLLSFTNIFDVTNMISNYQDQSSNYITNDAVVTNILVQAGYPQTPAGYTQFTNDMSASGVTNLQDLTNLSPGFSNIDTLASNVYNL